MNRILPIIMLAYGTLFADELIDDFEDGDSRNLRNLYWFYFSDVSDGGNSEILNAEIISPGTYSAVTPLNEDDDSNYYVKMEYMLGDIEPSPIKGFYNFVGIGTDIARPGGVADIRPAYGISFRARSQKPTWIFFELITSNIYDYGYYQAYFEVNNTWQTFKVEFNDSSNFCLPPWNEENHSLMLSKVQKFSWQITKGDNNEHNGYFCLDDIVLLDSSTVKTAHARMRIEKKPDMSKVTGDLLGRQIKNARFLAKVPGVYVNPGVKKLIWNRNAIETAK